MSREEGPVPCPVCAYTYRRGPPGLGAAYSCRGGGLLMRGGVTHSGGGVQQGGVRVTSSRGAVLREYRGLGAMRAEGLGFRRTGGSRGPVAGAGGGTPNPS